MSDDDHSRDLVDDDLAGEIELVSDLVVAASTSTRHFTPAEVDALLGIDGTDLGTTSRDASLPEEDAPEPEPLG